MEEVVVEEQVKKTAALVAEAAVCNSSSKFIVMITSHFVTRKTMILNILQSG
jgi:hypothetical protein